MQLAPISLKLLHAATMAERSVAVRFVAASSGSSRRNMKSRIRPISSGSPISLRMHVHLFARKSFSFLGLLLYFKFPVPVPVIVLSGF